MLTFGIAALAGCAPQATVGSSQSQIPAVAPGAARVWFLRGWDAPSGQGFVLAAAPVVFANGSPVGDIPIGSGFFRDFSPGTYNFTIQPFGLPTPQSTTLQLAAGTQTYVQAQWLASWQVGYPEADFSFRTQYFRYPDNAPAGSTSVSAYPDLSPASVDAAGVPAPRQPPILMANSLE